MKLKKHMHFWWVLMLVATLGLAGCGGSAQTSQSTQHKQSEETAVQEAETPEAPDISPTHPVKATVEEYSWDELSQIAQEICAVEGEDAAIDLATQYHLCTSTGELDGTQTKTLELSDGTQTTALIVGFNHDDKTDGGKAGITFMFDDAIAIRPMNVEETNVGGWKDSDLRAWLASEGMSMLPSDLQSTIVSVEKLTNNVGDTTSTSSVTPTSDTLWLFSLAELYGDISFYSTNDDFSPVYDDVIGAEGSQYKFFDDMDVDIDDDDLTILVRNYQGEGGFWWVRTPLPDDNENFLYQFSLSGNVVSSYPANHDTYVVPGFCL